jgi:hypothetical protein
MLKVLLVGGPGAGHVATVQDHRGRIAFEARPEIKFTDDLTPPPVATHVEYEIQQFMSRDGDAYWIGVLPGQDAIAKVFQFYAQHAQRLTKPK